METLQLLDAVSRVASLGFEKSYREVVVLLIRGYLSKLSSIGSAGMEQNFNVLKNYLVG